MSETKSNNYNNLRGNTTPGYLDSGNGLKYGCESMNPYSHPQPPSALFDPTNIGIDQFEQSSQEAFVGFIQNDCQGFEYFLNQGVNQQTFNKAIWQLLFSICQKLFEFNKLSKKNLYQELENMGQKSIIGELEELLKKSDKLDWQMAVFNLAKLSSLPDNQYHFKSIEELRYKEAADKAENLLLNTEALLYIRNEYNINPHDFDELLAPLRSRKAAVLAYDLLEQDLSSLQLQNKINEYKSHKIYVQELYEKLAKEEEEAEDKETFQILKKPQQKIDYLPKSLEPLRRYIQTINWDETAATMVIMGAVSGVLANGFTVSIPECGWTESCLSMFTSIVARSGSMKTPLMGNLAFNPIIKIAKLINENYQKAYSDWESQGEKDEPEPLLPRKLIMGDLTKEALSKVAQVNNGNGTLIAKDELSGFFHGLNQYKGKGDDVEFYCELWNGRIFPRERAGEKFNTDGIFDFQTGIVGGIQPKVLSKLFGSSTIGNGFFCKIQLVSERCK